MAEPWVEAERLRAEAYLDQQKARASFQATIKAKLAGNAEAARGLFDRTKALIDWDRRNRA